MVEKVLTADAKEALALLGESDLLDGAYLAGGTALALRFGHRLSFDFDLDFFTQVSFDEKMLVQRLGKLPFSFELERTAWGTVLGYINKTRFSIFCYDYPILGNLDKFLGVTVASISDIAPMKLAAISERGTRRDFIDLYWIVQKEKALSLEEAFSLYEKKFRALNPNKAHLLKSLAYFADAERDTAPKMLLPVNWQEVKRWFENESRKIGKKLLG